MRIVDHQGFIGAILDAVDDAIGFVGDVNARRDLLLEGTRGSRAILIVS